MEDTLQIHNVPAERLDREKGDIASAYSADTIAGGGKIRKPFNWHGGTWVTVAIMGDRHEAYLLVEPRLFPGITTTYNGKVGTMEGAEAARNDPNGFYHGMAIKSAGATLILSGPPALFVADAEAEPQPAQLSLF